MHRSDVESRYLEDFRMRADKLFYTFIGFAVLGTVVCKKAAERAIGLKNMFMINGERILSKSVSANASGVDGDIYRPNA